MRYVSPDGAGELRADLTVACDGRGSWSVTKPDCHPGVPVPFDVWWFRLPREMDASYSLIPRTGPGRVVIMLPREGLLPDRLPDPEGQ